MARRRTTRGNTSEIYRRIVAYRGSLTSQQYTAIAQAIQQIIEPNQNLNLNQ
jgi:hypothetical protein